MHHPKDKIEILLSSEKIAERVSELGAQITADYESISKPLVLVSVLKGAAVILTDLMRHIDLPVEIEFLRISSYGDETESSGKITQSLDVSTDLKDRHVLIVEDIVDTGLSADYLLNHLKTKSCASVKLCSLLEKPEKSKGTIPIDYLGFSIADSFVVGYGLDYAGIYRNLPFIGVLTL